MTSSPKRPVPRGPMATILAAAAALVVALLAAAAAAHAGGAVGALSVGATVVRVACPPGQSAPHCAEGVVSVSAPGDDPRRAAAGVAASTAGQGVVVTRTY